MFDIQWWDTFVDAKGCTTGVGTVTVVGYKLLVKRGVGNANFVDPGLRFVLKWVFDGVLYGVEVT